MATTLSLDEIRRRCKKYAKLRDKIGQLQIMETFMPRRIQTRANYVLAA